MSTANCNISTGLRTMRMTTGSMKTILDAGCIWVYSGAKPADADSAVSGTLVAQITKDGAAWVAGNANNGLVFATPAVLGVMSKNTDDWKMVGKAIGTAGWARFVGNPADAGGASNVLPRIDFDVGTTSGVLQLTSLATTVGSITTIDTFSLVDATQ
jgi:hypothetical protein